VGVAWLANSRGDGETADGRLLTSKLTVPSFGINHCHYWLLNCSYFSLEVLSAVVNLWVPRFLGRFG